MFNCISVNPVNTAGFIIGPIAIFCGTILKLRLCVYPHIYYAIFTDVYITAIIQDVSCQNTVIESTTSAQRPLNR